MALNAPATPLTDDSDTTAVIPKLRRLGVARVHVLGSGGSARKLRRGASVCIGSGAGADLQVDDRTVSSRHCRLIHRGNTLELIDLGSRNGIRLGGATVQRAVLSDDCVFEIGRTAVRLTAQRQNRHVSLPGMVGDAEAMRQLATLVRRCAPLGVAVLIQGQSGTGKELVAQAIHCLSSVQSGPFVAINGATLTADLAGSELFGHRRGAFTGAVRDRVGAFRRADGGTLFIDEVGSIPLTIQVKLLRALEESAVTPVGADEPEAVNVRVLAATCEPLEQMLHTRRFRVDLYQRLAACLIRVPSLSERLGDLPALARHLLASSEMATYSLTDEAVEQLKKYRWPGNVRELRNVLVQAAVRSSGPRLYATDIRAALADRALDEVKRLAPEQAQQLLGEANGNVSAAARRARLPRSTFRDLLRAAERTP